MGGKSQGSTTSTQKNDPWIGQQPYYNDIFNQSRDLYSSGQLNSKPYQGQQIASQAPDTLAAQEMVRNNAANQSINSAANQLTTDTLGGKYLDPTTNPGWQQGLTDIKRAYATGTAAQTDAAAAKSGAYGGSAYNELVGQNQRSYADSLNNFAGNLYNQERNNQLGVLGQSPQINAANYYGAGQLANVGATNENYQQDLINQAINDFNINQNAPYDALQKYSGLIGGNLGSSSTSTSPIYRNRSGSALGGAAAGASAGSAFGPWGAAIGGIGGGALGYFSS
jgi:hypothetical protein